MYNIYCHTTPDGKKYVGITKQENPNIRWMNGHGYKHQNLFFNAIIKFGWDNIQHEVVDVATGKETAVKLEEYYTLLWRTNEPEFGYNVKIGDKPVHLIGNKWNEGKHLSEETKKKISESLKGRKLSEEICRKYSDAHKKPIKVKNMVTNEIIKFDCNESCAAFFKTTISTVMNWKKGSKPRVFSDYKLLKSKKVGN